MGSLPQSRERWAASVCFAQRAAAASRTRRERRYAEVASGLASVRVGEPAALLHQTGQYSVPSQPDRARRPPAPLDAHRHLHSASACRGRSYWHRARPRYARRGKPYYLSLRGRGMSTTAAFVALGRKLARVCFALLKNGTDFTPDGRSGACAATCPVDGSCSNSSQTNSSARYRCTAQARAAVGQIAGHAPGILR